MNRPLFGTLACIGDSLTYPARTVRGFPERMAELAREVMDKELQHTTWLALNRGVCGETTWQILQRLPGVLRELTAYPGAHLLTILAGTNDLKEGLPLEESLKNLYEMLLWCQRYPQVGVLVGGLPMVWPEKMPSFWRVQAENRMVYNGRLKGMVLAMGKRFVPLEMDGILCGDGVHLSDFGVEKVAEAFFAAAFPSGVSR